MSIRELADKVVNGYVVSASEAMELYQEPLEALCSEADRIRRHFCSDHFDICAIVNGKCGRCSENCRFCAQSAFNDTGVESYPLLSSDVIADAAEKATQHGIQRFSIVTSGRKLSEREVDEMCTTAHDIHERCGISLCVSFGLLDENAFRKLREAGVSRVHCNIETSRRYFPYICTTHSFEDKIETIKAAQRAGLEVCSGGIMGLGETPEDRIDMAITLRELGIMSIPLNMLNPIPGTSFGNNKKLTSDDMRRIIAVFRFLIPEAAIRSAGGRALLPDNGRSCFLSGANAAISGDMLTTAGITAAKDMEMLTELGYRIIKQG